MKMMWQSLCGAKDMATQPAHSDVYVAIKPPHSNDDMLWADNNDDIDTTGLSLGHEITSTHPFSHFWT